MSGTKMMYIYTPYDCGIQEEGGIGNYLDRSEPITNGRKI